MSIGFRASDDEQEPAPDVVDGRADKAELSAHEECDLFVSLATRLREMGATEVRMGGLRATFGAPPAPPRVIPTAKPEKKRKPSPVADVFPDQPGDTAEDKERRARYRDIAGVVAP